MAGSLLEDGAQIARARPKPDHYHVVRGCQFSAKEGQKAPGRQTEQEQSRPAIDREERQKGAAEVEPQKVLEQNHTHGARHALAGSVAKDFARVGRIKPIVDSEPKSETDPNDDDEAQHEGFHWQEDKEDAFQREE